MSNRDFQPLKFACKGCGSLIGLNFNVKNAHALDIKALRAMLNSKDTSSVRLDQGVTWNITGAKEIPGDQPFKPGTDFVDLHLDFPVGFGEYERGNTPFLQALARIGGERAAFHRDRLQLINEDYKKYGAVCKLISMYIKGFHGPFREVSQKRFNIMVKSIKIEDINAALYTVISRYVIPFTLPDNHVELAEYYGNVLVDLMRNKETQTSAFLQKLHDSAFLAHMQRDCLMIYKPIFEAELPLRPALFLDLDLTYSEGRIPMRVSSQDFLEYREVYKDMTEILSRQLVLVAAINNLLKRGDHDLFAKGIWVTAKGKDLAPSSLDAYADMPLGDKPKYLDDTWYTLNPSALDNKLRNAIAHNKLDYDEIKQRITYYPKLEGMEREKKEEIQLIDYMRRMLVLFREVHRLHHLVKCLNYAILLEPGASMIKRSQPNDCPSKSSGKKPPSAPSSAATGVT
jgi:hypothetical protein